MLTALRQMMKRMIAASPAEVEGLGLIARLDGEIAVMTKAVKAAHGSAETALCMVARARLTVLQEAAIAARALRPEHIRFSGALACLQQGAVFAPMAGQAAVQLLARVA